jgi:hypothetical protein
MSNQFSNSTDQSNNNNKFLTNQQQQLQLQQQSRTAANTTTTTSTGLVNKHLAAVTGNINKSNIHNLNKKTDQTQSDSSNSFIRQVSF